MGVVEVRHIEQRVSVREQGDGSLLMIWTPMSDLLLRATTPLKLVRWGIATGSQNWRTYLSVTYLVTSSTRTRSSCWLAPTPSCVSQQLDHSEMRGSGFFGTMACATIFTLRNGYMRCCQQVSFGTQKVRLSRYSPGSAPVLSALKACLQSTSAHKLHRGGKGRPFRGQTSSFSFVQTKPTTQIPSVTFGSLGP